MFTITTAALFGFLLVVVWAAQSITPSRYNKLDLSFPKFVRCWDILGILNLLESIRELSHHQHLDASAARFAKHGHTYTTWFKGTKATLTCDEQLIKAVFATNMIDFRFGTRRREAFRQLLGHGIFFAEGSEWVASRRLLRPSFTNEMQGITDVIQPHIDNLCNAIDRQQASLGHVELRSVFHSFTLDVSTHIFLGQSCFSLRHDLAGRGQEFQRAYDACMERVVRDFIIHPLNRLLPDNAHQQDMLEVHAFVDEHVTRVLADRQRGNQSFDDQSYRDNWNKSVLEQLSEEVIDDPVRLRSECLNLLFAGRDSTASLLTNCFYSLSRSPSVWKALRDEIEAQPDGKILDFTVLKSLPYLQACLQESLRLHPPVFFNNRTAIRDTLISTSKGPLLVQKNQQIVCNIYALHHRKDIYGADADDFRPERWLESKRIPWTWLPFSGGPRTCLGQQMALSEAGYLIARLVKRFRTIEAVSREEPWTEHLEFTCATKSGTEVRFGI